MTGTAITLGVDGKLTAEPTLPPSRMSPLRRNSLMHQNAHLHQGAHLHEEVHLHQEAQLHQGSWAYNKVKEWQDRLRLHLTLFLASDHETHFHHQGALFNHEADLHHAGVLLHQDNQAPLLHYEAKAKASLRVSERTWESRRIKEEMQGIVSPTPLELHKVSPSPGSRPGLEQAAKLAQELVLVPNLMRD